MINVNEATMLHLWGKQTVAAVTSSTWKGNVTAGGYRWPHVYSYFQNHMKYNDVTLNQMLKLFVRGVWFQ